MKGGRRWGWEGKDTDESRAVRPDLLGASGAGLCPRGMVNGDGRYTVKVVNSASLVRKAWTSPSEKLHLFWLARDLLEGLYVAYGYCFFRAKMLC